MSGFPICKQNRANLFKAQDYLLEKGIGLDLQLEEGTIQKTPTVTNTINMLTASLIKTEHIDFSTNTFAELQTSSNHVFSMRSYVCDKEGCNKTFTSSHGLEYHKKHGHFEFKTLERRPYICQVPGCNKSYKNNNGLKYHVTHGHKDIPMEEKWGSQ